MSLSHFNLENPFEDIIAALKKDGGVIIDNFIGQDVVESLNRELLADMGVTQPGTLHGAPDMAEFWGSNTKRLTRLLSRSPAFAALLDHDFMHRWAQHDLSGDYWLNTGQAMWVGPGEPAQVLHRDVASWPLILELGSKAPQVMVEVVVALTNFTEAVGATRIVPGSHLWDDFGRQARPEESVPAVMPAGGAVLYTSKTIHGAGKNQTADQWRHGIQLSYLVGWLTPEEAVPIGTPWSVASAYSDRVQRMLGFASPGFGEDYNPRCWTMDFEDIRAFLGKPFKRPTKRYEGTLDFSLEGPAERDKGIE